MRRDRDRIGLTLVELMVVMFLLFFLSLVLGRVILQNQRSWQWGRDKAVLQQNVSESLEWMARWIRASRTLEVVGTNELRTFDETGSLTRTFRRDVVGGEDRLLENGTSLIDRSCTAFVVSPDEDTTSVTLLLELEGRYGDRVSATTRVAIRNRDFGYGTGGP